MLDKFETETACNHALDEIRSYLDDVSDSPMKNRTFKLIEQLEVYIEKLLQQETRQRLEDY